MYNILVPTDFSYNADKALNYARDFVKESSGSITVFHSYHEPVLSPATDTEGTNKLAGQIKSSKQNNLKNHVEDYFGHEHEIRFKYEVAEGSLVENITRIIAKESFDLIIMGTRGAGEHLSVGSNTSQVIRNVKCPVLAIPEKAAYKPVRKIVYALDYEDFDQLTIRNLKTLADKFGAEIILLHVNPVEHYWEEEKARQYHSAMDTLKDYDRVRFEFLQSEDICQAIEDFVRKHDIDVLAMLTRDYHLIEKPYDKSLTKKMLFHCDIPLLAFHE